MNTTTRIINPRIELTCNGEKTRGYYAVASPAEITCRIDLISEDGDSPYCPHVLISQRGQYGQQHGSAMPSRCDKNAWQFTYKARTLGMLVERMEMFIAHPMLRGIQMFSIDVVDETKEYFSIVRGHVVSRIHFMFEEGLQCTDNGVFSSFPNVLAQRNTKPFRFYGMQDGKKCASPDIPYLSITAESYNKCTAAVPGIKVGNSYLFSVEDKKEGLYEANICARLLPPDIYNLNVYCPFSDFILGHTRIHTLNCSK